MRRFSIFLTALPVLLLTAGPLLFGAGSSEESGVVNVYSHRHYDADRELYKAFEAETGIRVNVVQAKADELIERMRSEGAASPADLLITADAGRLVRAESLGLLQSVSSVDLDRSVPSHLRDPEGFWFGLTKRARVIVWDTGKRNAPGISSYAELASPDLKGGILIRSSGNIYNISLLASMVETLGSEGAAAWADGVVGNMARTPQGNDRDQMKALIAGVGDYAVVNTYYVGLLIDSSDPAEAEVGNRIGILFPDQEGEGTHINISGAGVAAHAPNPENAIRLLEFLTSERAQAVFAEQNYEYPVNPAVEPSGLVASWGGFRESTINLQALGDNADEAVRIFDEAGWR